MSNTSPGSSFVTILQSPTLLTREVLAGVITALALIPEVISFSVIAGVDPKVSLIASVVLCLSMSFLGGRPAMVTAAAGSVALVIGPMVHQHGVAYILPAVVMAGLIQILFALCGMAKLMRFIPASVMSGFVNALGILIFFAQVPHFWSRSRQSLWHKGGTSGHVQKVHSIRLDCDRDALVILVEQVGGAACHTGFRSCFYRELKNGAVSECCPVVFDPKEVYK